MTHEVKKIIWGQNVYMISFFVFLFDQIAFFKIVLTKLKITFPITKTVFA